MKPCIMHLLLCPIFNHPPFLVFKGTSNLLILLFFSLCGRLELLVSFCILERGKQCCFPEMLNGDVHVWFSNFLGQSGTWTPEKKKKSRMPDILQNLLSIRSLLVDQYKSEMSFQVDRSSLLNQTNSV